MFRLYQAEDFINAQEYLLTIMEKQLEIKDLLSNERREDMLCGALEGGSNYWYYLPDLSMCKEYQAPGDTTCGYMIKAIIAGESIPVHDIESESREYGELLGMINIESIRKGEVLMKEKAFMCWGDLITEQDDAETADVWFQFCVMGEVVFG